MVEDTRCPKCGMMIIDGVCVECGYKIPVEKPVEKPVEQGK